MTGAVADSRAAGPGDLYVAIVGERVDGHDFSDAAHAAGAVVTLGSRPTGQPTIVVPGDPVDALGRLASHTLDRLPAARVVAITGSSGKTTTKDLIATLLEDVGPTVAPSGSFNTEVGLPLTILRATEDTRFLVLEMGARGIGHVAALCRIAPPDVSVVLNVGSAHLGEFGSREAIGRAKGEIVEALDADGLAVLNADDPIVAGMVARSVAPIVTFGSSPDADVRAVGLTLDASARATFTLHTPSGDAEVQMAMVGEHMAANACAAAAVALHFGMTPARARRAARQRPATQPVAHGGHDDGVRRHRRQRRLQRQSRVHAGSPALACGHAREGPHHRGPRRDARAGRRQHRRARRGGPTGSAAGHLQDDRSRAGGARPLPRGGPGGLLERGGRVRRRCRRGHRAAARPGPTR